GNHVAQPDWYVSLAELIVTPRNETAISSYCDVVVSRARNLHHIAKTRWQIGLSPTVISPHQYFATGHKGLIRSEGNPCLIAYNQSGMINLTRCQITNCGADLHHIDAVSDEASRSGLAEAVVGAVIKPGDGGQAVGRGHAVENGIRQRNASRRLRA